MEHPQKKESKAILFTIDHSMLENDLGWFSKTPDEIMEMTAEDIDKITEANPALKKLKEAMKDI
jgi:hypothetical protein